MAVVDAVLGAVRAERPFCAFLDAPGGTSKTYCFNTMLAKARADGHIALAVASSGIAAILLDGGRTLHSRFKAPLKPTETDPTWIKAETNLANLVRRAKLIIWDEGPMSPKEAANAADDLLRDSAGWSLRREDRVVRRGLPPGSTGDAAFGQIGHGVAFSEE